MQHVRTHSSPTRPASDRAAAALAWLPQSLAADPVPTLRELARAASDGEAQAIARERIAALERLAHVAGQCAQMELAFLYDRGRHLLTTGYNLDEHRAAPGYYAPPPSVARPFRPTCIP